MGHLPQAEETCLTHANIARIVTSLEGAEDNNRECTRVLEGIGKMLSAPAR